jgi:hypothetical protein
MRVRLSLTRSCTPRGLNCVWSLLLIFETGFCASGEIPSNGIPIVPMNRWYLEGPASTQRDSEVTNIIRCLETMNVS